MATPVSTREIKFRVDPANARTNRKGRPPLIPVEVDFTSPDDPRLGAADLELARLCLTALSRFVGNQSGQRGAVPRLSKLLASLAHIPMDDGTPLFPEMPLRGWPAMSGVYNRADARGHEWRSTFVVDELWSLSLGLEGIRATLPLQLVVEIFPPQLWPMVAQVIEWGPREFALRCDRFFHLGAREQAPGFGRMSKHEIRHHQGAAWQFMEALADLEEHGYPQSLLRRAAIPCATHAAQREGEPGCPLCIPDLSWRRSFIPARRRTREYRPRATRGVRTAPEKDVVQRALFDLDREIAERRRSNAGYMRLQKPLRDRALLELFCVIGGRAEAISLLRKGRYHRRPGEIVMSVEWEHTFLDGSVGLGIGLFPGKTEENLEEDVQRWKKIPSRTAAHFREYWDYVGLDLCPDGQPIWFGDWEYLLEATGDVVPRPEYTTAVPAGIVRRPVSTPMAASYISNRIATILKRYGGDRPYRAHTLRHLAHQLAEDGARDHLLAHPETAAKIAPQIIVKSLLDHSFGQISERYNGVKTEESRECWAAIVAAEVEELLLGERGQKKDIDRIAIVAARQDLEEAKADFSAAEEQLSAVDIQQRALEEGASSIHTRLSEVRAESSTEIERLRSRERELRRQVRTRSTSLTDEQWRALQIELLGLSAEIDARRDAAGAFESELRDEIEREQARLAREQRHGTEALLELQARIAERERVLQDVCARRVPIPPHASKRTDDELAAEIEQLVRGHLPEKQTLSPIEREQCRDWLAPKEFAEALGIKPQTLRAQIARALASPSGLPFEPGDRRNPWHQPIFEIFEVRGGTGSRTRRFIFSRLDLSKYHPTQIARMREFLANPAPHAGRPHSTSSTGEPSESVEEHAAPAKLA